MAGFGDIERTLLRLRRRQMYRQRRVLGSAQGPWVEIDGRRLLNFCSNDYLGLAADARVRRAFAGAVERWGVGAGASHLVCGHTAAHAELEAALAEFTGRPRALVYSSGYAANMGVIQTLLGAGDLVCEDRLNHASLLDGGRISRATFCWYAHRDMADLAARLDEHAGQVQRRLIVSDGTFSMDGDLCPLQDLVALARRHDAWVMIDDAHGIGVHGTDGCGLVDPARYDTEAVPVLVGTLGKALGTGGAFIAGSEALIELLIQRSRNYIYSTAMPSAMAVATLQSLAIVREEGWRRAHLAELIAQFRRGAARLGLELLPSAAPIQPLILGESAAALAFSAALEQRGLLVTAIRPPTVPPGTARLRITLTAAHEPAQVDTLLAALAEIRGELALEQPA